MILTGSRSIRDVILFPLLRPQPKRSDQSPTGLRRITCPAALSSSLVLPKRSEGPAVIAPRHTSDAHTHHTSHHVPDQIDHLLISPVPKQTSKTTTFVPKIRLKLR